MMSLKGLSKLMVTVAGVLGFLAIPGYSSPITSLIFNKTGSAAGTFTNGTSGTFYAGQLITNFLDGTSNTYTLQTGNTAGGVKFTYSDLTHWTIAFSSATLSTPTGTGPGVSLSNLSSTLQLYSGTTSITSNNAPANTNYSDSNVPGIAVGLPSAFLTDIGAAVNTLFNVSGGWNGAGSSINSDSVTFTAVPEPSSVILFASVLIALALTNRKHLQSNR